MILLLKFGTIAFFLAETFSILRAFFILKNLFTFNPLFGLINNQSTTLYNLYILYIQYNVSLSDIYRYVSLDHILHIM